MAPLGDERALGNLAETAVPEVAIEPVGSTQVCDEQIKKPIIVEVAPGAAMG
jgi:hypothetical protein